MKENLYRITTDWTSYGAQRWHYAYVVASSFDEAVKKMMDCHRVNYTSDIHVESVGIVATSGNYGHGPILVV